MVLFGLPYGSDQSCSVTLVDHGRGYLGILVSCLICESAIMWLSMRGSILYTQPREAVQYVIYIRLGIGRIPFSLQVTMNAFILFGCITLLPHWSLSSYSVGGVGVCCGGNCLARPLLPAVLWCHCQKLGFGWVRGPKKKYKRMLFWFVFKVIVTVCAGIVACNWLVILSVCITLMCTFDPTGRTFVKLKATRRRQRNLTTYTLRY